MSAVVQCARHRSLCHPDKASNANGRNGASGQLRATVCHPDDGSVSDGRNMASGFRTAPRDAKPVPVSSFARCARPIRVPVPAREEVTLQHLRFPFPLGKRLLSAIRFPFPLGKGLGVRLPASSAMPAVARYSRHRAPAPESKVARRAQLCASHWVQGSPLPPAAQAII
jgi:hypothetical protein